MGHLTLQVRTPAGGFSMPLTQQPVAIGRAPDNQLQLHDEQVSPYHCVLVPIEDELYVVDRRSAAGTYLNEAPVGFGRLGPNDVLRLGSVRISLGGQSAEQAAEAAVGFRPPSGPRMTPPAGRKPAPRATGKADSGAPIKVIPDADLDRPPLARTPRLLGELLLPREMDGYIRGFLRRHAGAMVICGPAGSGKTTTAYTLLRLLAADKRKIVTFEQPPEFPLPSAQQIFVHHAREYAPAVERMARAGPHVMFLGEPPTPAAANIAFRAAIGRCMVIAVTASVDSPGAIHDLLEQGVEPQVVADSLGLVIAQRLVRRLCEQCKRPMPIPPEHAGKLAPFMPRIDHIDTPDACPICNNTGFVGHIAVFEILQVSDAIRSVVGEKPSLTNLHNAAQDPRHLIPMPLSAYARVAQGLTSIEEADQLVAALSSEVQSA